MRKEPGRAATLQYDRRAAAGGNDAGAAAAPDEPGFERCGRDGNVDRLLDVSKVCRVGPIFEHAADDDLLGLCLHSL